MSDADRMIALVGLAFAICVALFGDNLAGRVAQKLRLHSPPWVRRVIMLCVLIVICVAVWVFMEMQSQKTKPTPPSPAVVASPISTGSPTPRTQPSKKDPRAIAGRPKVSASPRATATVEVDPRPDYTCGPPFYLAWVPQSIDPEKPPARDPIGRCSGPMSENGYAHPFKTKAAALAATAQMNVCAGPNSEMRADFDKC